MVLLLCGCATAPTELPASQQVALSDVCERFLVEHPEITLPDAKPEDDPSSAFYADDAALIAANRTIRLHNKEKRAALACLAFQRQRYGGAKGK